MVLLVAAEERERRAEVVLVLLLDLLTKDAARRVANANIFVVVLVSKINSINWKESLSAQRVVVLAVLFICLSALLFGGFY